MQIAFVYVNKISKFRTIKYLMRHLCNAKVAHFSYILYCFEVSINHVHVPPIHIVLDVVIVMLDCRFIPGRAPIQFLCSYLCAPLGSQDPRPSGKSSAIWLHVHVCTLCIFILVCHASSSCIARQPRLDLCVQYRMPATVVQYCCT